MKRIYFCRHAKSSWDDPALRDHDRPLNARGNRDAPIMARYLFNQGVQPDALVTSTARRTLETAKAFQKAGQISDEDFLVYKDLYHSSPAEMIEVLKEMPADYNTVILFAHNPGMTSMINIFSSEYIDNVPTCGVFEVQFEVDDWTLISAKRGSGTLARFWTPKTIF